jgi:4-hydroxy-3-polyprenylbenzoate decarboxylase
MSVSSDTLGSIIKKDLKYNEVVLHDVILKERRKLILVARDTPFNLIHINNMKTITEAGGIICPATPSFYSNPSTFEELAATVVDRVIALAGLEQNSYQWGQ